MTPSPLEVGSLITAVVAALITIFTFFKTARKDALDEANKQIGILSTAQEKLRKEYDALWEQFQSERQQWQHERDDLKEILGIALRYIQRLTSIMAECNIAVPAMPERLHQYDETPSDDANAKPARTRADRKRDNGVR